MTTREEYEEEAKRQQHLLEVAWTKLFMKDDLGDYRASFQQDHNHPPFALANMLDELYEEVIEKIVYEAGEAIAAGHVTTEAAPDLVMSSIVHMARTTAIRMFRMGQTMKDVLPYEDLLQCPCSTLFDDEVSDLLTIASIDPELAKGGET